MAALLAECDAASISDDELIEVVGGYRRLTSWAQAAELSAISELMRRREAGRHERPHQAWPSEHGLVDAVADEVALALTLTVGSAGCWVVLAEDLATRLSDTHRALAEGRIDLPRARVISDGLASLDDGLARRVEQRVLAKAGEQTTGKLRALVRQLVAEADPGAARQRRRNAEEQRRLEVWDTPDGATDLAGRDLPTAAATAAFNKIHAIAQALAADGDTRGIDQIRADLFLDLLRGRPLPEAARTPTSYAPGHRSSGAPAPSSGAPAPPSNAPTPPSNAFASDTHTAPEKAQGRMDEAAVGAAMATSRVADAIADAVAAAISQQLSGLRALPGLAQLRADRRGGTAMLAQAAADRIAEAIAELKLRWCDALAEHGDGWRAADRTGHGHDGYRPPAAMRRLVQDRDGRCMFPTCRRPATQSDLDHSVPFDKGGTTCPCNLAPLCRRHHQVKQDHRWRVLQPWPGIIVWITPAGKWYIARPDRE
ncbi:MAG: DUF222 domain-containing protein [Streptosporangiales bacterium]|nr:DUF222 domain-containing protein [Streptosporangiales bacterium]